MTVGIIGAVNNAAMNALHPLAVYVYRCSHFPLDTPKYGQDQTTSMLQLALISELYLYPEIVYSPTVV